MDTSVPVLVINRPYDDGAVEVARTLGRLGVPVYVITQEGMQTPVRHSRFWAGKFRGDFTKSAAECLAFMLDVGRQIEEKHHARPVLLTFSDNSAVFIERNADALEERFVFPRAPDPVIHRLVDKWGMHELARERGIPTPKTINVTSPQDAERFVELGPFPIVLKAADPFQARKPPSRILESERELRDAVADELAFGPLNFILQEHIPGSVESVWMCNGYFGLAPDATVTYTGKKLRQLNATGRASLAVCVPNETVSAQTRDFMHGVGYRGCVGIGWRYDARDGLYKVLDVNARVSGVFRLFAGTNDMDVVRACYRDLTGQPIPPTALRVGRKWMLEDDFFGALRAIGRREMKVGDWVKSMRGLRESQWLALDDPAPFVVWMWNRTRLFAGDRLPRRSAAR